MNIIAIIPARMGLSEPQDAQGFPRDLAIDTDGAWED